MLADSVHSFSPADFRRLGVTMNHSTQKHASRSEPNNDRVALRILNRIACDERGGEVLEYALIAGLIVIVAIGVITSVGGKVLARWQSLNSSM
jgi:Flp pilus assembly pilin Flp